MKKMMVLAVIISLAIFMLFSASGCNVKQKIAEEAVEEAIEKVIESESGGEADVEISEEGASIKTDEGEVAIGEKAELPDGFPDVVPVYPDMEIITSWKGTEDEKTTFSVSALTSDPGSTVFDWYKSKLGGWETENEFTNESEGEVVSSISASNGTYSLVIMVIDTGEETTVSIAVSEV